MFWSAKKKEVTAEPSPRFDHPVGTIRVSQYPDARWRCQIYGLYIPSEKPYYVPGWAGLTMPPGNKAGFDSEDAAVAAWQAYSERQSQADRIVFTPPVADTKGRQRP